MTRILPLALLLAVLPQPAVAQNAFDREISELTQRVERLEGTRAVKKLQRAFGFYVDRGLWGEAADLFTDDGTIEIGLDGVYVGRERIERRKRRHSANASTADSNAWWTSDPDASVGTSSRNPARIVDAAMNVTPHPDSPGAAFDFTFIRTLSSLRSVLSEAPGTRSPQQKHTE